MSAANDPTIRIRTAIAPSVVQRNAALQFLKGAVNNRVVFADHQEPNPGAFFRDVAILTEYNTGFGRSQAYAQAAAANLRDGPLEMRYPMYLSRLYSKYAKERQEREQRVMGMHDSAKTGLDSREPRPNADTVTGIDVDTTPPINDRTIDDITATLLRERIRYVGIMSTSPQDKVFLVERIRTACPNVTIFINGIESYYALPENRYTMRGVVFASSYPLYPANDEWVTPLDRRRQTFISNPGLGYFNAAAYHLGHLLGKPTEIPEKLQEHAPPKFVRDFRSLIPQKEAYKPPVWITTLNEHGRFVPLEVFDEYTDGGLMLTAAAPPAAATMRVSRPLLGPYRVVVLLTLLVAILALIRLYEWRKLLAKYGSWKRLRALLNSCWRPIRQSADVIVERIRRYPARRAIAVSSPDDPGDAPGDPAEGPAPPEGKRPAKHKRPPKTASPARSKKRVDRPVAVHQFLGHAAIVVAMTPVIVSTFILLDPWYERQSPNFACLVCFLALATAVTSASLLIQVVRFDQILRREPKEMSRRTRNVDRGIAAVLLVGQIAFIGIAIGWLAMADRPDRFLFAERAIGILNGYSVLAPLLLLAAGFLAKSLFDLHKQYIGRKFLIECPYPSDLDPREIKNPLVAATCNQIAILARDLRGDLTGVWSFARRRKWQFIAGAAAFGLLVMVLEFRALRVFEGLAWGQLFIGGFLLLVLLIGIDLYRFVSGWKTLSKILDKIALVPMVRAFDRLPRKTSTLFAGYFFTHRPQGSHLVVPYHILRQLPRGSAPIDAIRIDIEKALMGQTAGNTDSEYPGEKIRKLNEIARLLIGRIAPEWPSHAMEDAFGQDGAGEPAPGPHAAAPIAAARAKNADSSAVADIVRKAEDFIAIQAIIFLSQYMILLKTIAWSLICMSVALLLAATVYPFQPERLILILVLVPITAVGCAIFQTLVSYNKNEIISRATQSTPHRFDLTWGFVFNVVTFVGPLVLVVAAHLSGRLRSLVEPMLEGIR